MYTREKSIQMLIALLKAHNIRKIIISPGATNVTFVASVQKDPFFELYSSVDERSAAYMACGMAAESGEAVALSCTGATSSRNYVPGLTEAFYRKLPVLALTASQPIGRIGHGFPQMLDRSNPMNDIVRKSINLDPIHSEEDRWSAETAINDALLELHHDGGGPVHINVVTTFDGDYSATSLPAVRKITRHVVGDELPLLPEGRIAVFVGNHAPFSKSLQKTVDEFCATYNAVVLCDQTSNYRGEFRVLANLVSTQEMYETGLLDVDVLIHIGEISGSYMNPRPRTVWRVSPDGRVMDTFRTLTDVFQMKEEDFFYLYVQNSERASSAQTSYLDSFLAELGMARSKIPELPFSNIWCAQQMAPRLPEGSVLHLGILNSLRSWNFFDTPASVSCWSNTGGFGIDGGVSSLIGSALVRPEVPHFGVVGDLALFYDVNSLGNRHVMANVRLMVVNNGQGVEFRNYNHAAAKFGDDADDFISAAGHYGKKSSELLKHFATDLGFEYLCASNKEEFVSQLDYFLCAEITDKPLLFEVFTDPQLESDALKLINGVLVSGKGAAKAATKRAIRGIVGERGIQSAKRILKKD